MGFLRAVLAGLACGVLPGGGCRDRLGRSTAVAPRNEKRSGHGSFYLRTKPISCLFTLTCKNDEANLRAWMGMEGVCCRSARKVPVAKTEQTKPISDKCFGFRLVDWIFKELRQWAGGLLNGTRVSSVPTTR